MSPLLEGPILPTLLRLAVPNVFAMAAAAAVGIGETLYVGLLGKTSLAAMALVFPFVMLMQMLSSGAMGGGVSSAISRALGARLPDKARELAVHAVCLGAGLGLFFTLLLWTAGPQFYRLLGGAGEVLHLATDYGLVVFCATPAVWLFNTLVSLTRGSGNMRLPSVAVLATSLLQVALGAGLGLGLFGLPQWGLRGVALGQVIAYWVAAAALWHHVRTQDPRVRLTFAGVRLQWPLFADILRVGALACLNPVVSVGTVLVMTALVAAHGNDALAGYAIGSRLEFLLTPMAFGVGVAAVPMVGMAIGAGDVRRARHVAWTAALLSGALLGAIGLVLAVAPDLWVAWFSREGAVQDYARTYLRWAGPGFGFFGLGLTLYFAAQGSGQVGPPVAAAVLRLACVFLLGRALAAAGAGPVALFALVGGGMALYGISAALGMHLSQWGPRTPGLARVSGLSRPS